MDRTKRTQEKAPREKAVMQANIISSVSAKITLQKIEWVGAEHGD